MPIFRTMEWHIIKEAIDLRNNTFFAVNQAGGVAEVTMAAEFIRHIPQRDDGRGYLCCDIKIHGKWKTKKVHHLVMETFRGPTPKGYHIDHKDSDKTHNTPENLRWRKIGENSADCRRGSRKGVKPLTLDQRSAVKLLIASHWGTARIARAMGISETTVRRLRKEYEI